MFSKFKTAILKVVTIRISAFAEWRKSLLFWTASGGHRM